MKQGRSGGKSNSVLSSSSLLGANGAGFRKGFCGKPCRISHNVLRARNGKGGFAPVPWVTDCPLGL